MRGLAEELWVGSLACESEREKAAQIQKLMAQGGAKGSLVGRKPKVNVVVARGAHKGVKGRPKGVKGRYLMVDARMRKEVCRCR